MANRKSKRPRYSRRDIEQAAIICQGYASAPDHWNFRNAYESVADEEDDAVTLARAAMWLARYAQTLDHDESVAGAEAEAALRTGWLPDDEGRS